MLQGHAARTSVIKYIEQRYQQSQFVRHVGLVVLVYVTLRSQETTGDVTTSVQFKSD